MERGCRRIIVVMVVLGVMLSGVWGLTGWAENDTAESIQDQADSWHQDSQGLHGVSEGMWQEQSAFQSSTAGAETSHDAGAQMGSMELPHDSWTQGGRDGMSENAQGWQSLQMPTSGFGMPKDLSSQSQTSATEPAKDMTEQLQRLGVMSEQGVQIDRVGSQHQVTIPSDVQEMLKSQQASQPTMMRGAEPSGSSMSGTWTHTAPQEQRNLMGTNEPMGNQRDVSPGAHEMGRTSGQSSQNVPSDPLTLSGQGVVEIRQDSGPGGGSGGSGGEGRHR